MTEITSVVNLIGIDLTVRVIITLLVSFFSVTMIEVVKWIIEGIIKEINKTESANAIKKLEAFVYPFLTIAIAVPIPFFIKLNNYNLFINVCLYVSLNFIFYKILWKMIIKKVIIKLKKV